jgi:hypothetical protein
MMDRKEPDLTPTKQAISQSKICPKSYRAAKAAVFNPKKS